MASSLVEPLRSWLDARAEGGHASAPNPWQARLERAARRMLSDLDDPTNRTTSVDRYLHAAATGRLLRFEPKGETRLQLEGLVDLSSADVQAMQTRLEARLQAVLGPLTKGQPPESVMQAWRAECRPDLAEAERYCKSLRRATADPSGRRSSGDRPSRQAAREPTSHRLLTARESSSHSPSTTSWGAAFPWCSNRSSTMGRHGFAHIS